MKRRAARIDENQPEIIKALRAVGCSVTSLAAVGNGCPDLLVGRHGRNVLIEVKNENQPPSRRALSPDEKEWHLNWRGQVSVVNTVGEALRAIGL